MCSPPRGRCHCCGDSLAPPDAVVPCAPSQDHLQHWAEDIPGPDQDPLGGRQLSPVRLQPERAAAAAAAADAYTLLFPDGLQPIGTRRNTPFYYLTVENLRTEPVSLNKNTRNTTVSQISPPSEQNKIWKGILMLRSC